MQLVTTEYYLHIMNVAHNQLVVLHCTRPVQHILLMFRNQRGPVPFTGIGEVDFDQAIVWGVFICAKNTHGAFVCYILQRK
jgi:hypothetical protein